MIGRKKVQDLLVDAHISRHWRDEILILATPTEIVWVVGLRRDRRFLAGSDATDVVCLTVTPDTEGESKSCNDNATTSTVF